MVMVSSVLKGNAGHKGWDKCGGKVIVGVG
jgi:hypothetical protein